MPRQPLIEFIYKCTCTYCINHINYICMSNNKIHININKSEKTQHETTVLCVKWLINKYSMKYHDYGKPPRHLQISCSGDLTPEAIFFES